MAKRTRRTHAAAFKAKVAIAALAGDKTLAEGRPVVTTRVGMQGLDHLNDSICVTDDAMEFAMMAVRLLTDDARWLLQADAGLEAIRSCFTADIMASIMASAFDELEPLRIG